MSVVSKILTYVFTLKSQKSISAQVLYNVDNYIRIGTAHPRLHLHNNIVYNIRHIYVDNPRSICIKYFSVEATILPDIQR